MADISLVGSKLMGSTSGEHHGHYDSEGNPIHSSGTLKGFVVEGSSKLFVNGTMATCVSCKTEEYDNCGEGFGSVGSGSSKIILRGKNIAIKGSSINAHSGSANILDGISKVTVSG